jgi:hypothetical protein
MYPPHLAALTFPRNLYPTAKRAAPHQRLVLTVILLLEETTFGAAILSRSAAVRRDGIWHHITSTYHLTVAYTHFGPPQLPRYHHNSPHYRYLYFATLGNSQQWNIHLRSTCLQAILIAFHPSPFQPETTPAPKPTTCVRHQRSNPGRLYLSQSLLPQSYIEIRL